MGQGEETAERKCNCLFFIQRVSGRKHQAVLPMTPSDRWLFLSQVMNHLRTKRWNRLWDEFVCFSALCKRHLRVMPVSTRCGEFSPLSSTLPLYTCCTYTAGGWLPPPPVASMLLEVTFSIRTRSTLRKKYIYFRLDISPFIKLRASPLL